MKVYTKHKVVESEKKIQAIYHSYMAILWYYIKYKHPLVLVIAHEKRITIWVFFFFLHVSFSDIQRVSQ